MAVRGAVVMEAQTSGALAAAAGSAAAAAALLQPCAAASADAAGIVFMGSKLM